MEEMQGANKVKSSNIFLLQFLKVIGGKVQHLALCAIIVPLNLFSFFSLFFETGLPNILAERKRCFYSHNSFPVIEKC